jgi:HTH-type transcriptional regulator / antitoxin HigA
MHIRPIRTDKDHTEALKEIEHLWAAKRGTPEGDKLEVLAVLVDAYEKTRWPIEALDPIETIKAHMQATGRTQADLAKALGSRPRASEVMARKRPLTIDMVRKLATAWHLPADLLLAPYATEKPAQRKATKSGRTRAHAAA